jgi:hypothetical protein
MYLIWFPRKSKAVSVWLLNSKDYEFISANIDHTMRSKFRLLGPTYYKNVR